MRAAPRVVGALPPLAVNLALSLATVLVVGGLAEGVCRLLEDETPRPVASYITVWNDGEFFTVNSAATGWPPWEDYNRDGVRDREHALEKPAGVRRVICLGDSVTLGWGLDPPQAYPQVLQDLLDARGAGVEVFNMAFSGWSTRQERIAYERLARKYRPDQALLGVCLNDIPEIHNNLERPPRLMRALFVRSALVRTVVGARRREVRDVEEMFSRPDAPSVRAALERFYEEVRRLRREVEKDGARLVVVLFPFRLQLEAEAPPPVVQRTLASFAAGEGLAVLDLLPHLRDLGPAAFHDYDHLSAGGARRVAEVLADSGLVAPASRGPGPGTTIAHAAEAPTLPSLVRELGDSAAEVRAGAAWALGRLGPEATEAVAPLTARLLDASPGVRAGAAWALGRIGPPARAAASALAARLDDPSPDVRWRAGDALGELGSDPTALVPALASVLARDGAPGRADAAAALGRLGPAARMATGALVQALSDTRPEVRARASWALGEIGPEARQAVPALVTAVATPDVGWHAIDALGKMGPHARAAVPVLRGALSDPSGSVRWRAASALGHIGPDAREAAPDLVRALRDDADNVRMAAAKALGQIGAPFALAAPSLRRALGDADSRVRAEAATSLARLEGGGTEAIEWLANAAGDADPVVRAAALRSLGRLPRSPFSTAALTAALDDTDPSVRAEAARALRGRRRPSPDGGAEND